MCVVDSTAKLQTGQKMNGMPIPRSEMFSLVGNESKKTFHANTFTLIGRTLTHRVVTSPLGRYLSSIRFREDLTENNHEPSKLQLHRSAIFGSTKVSTFEHNKL
ncbi:hypothetical protein Tco_0980009 [Tanacetum coccineum]|uniref:Uncharacterized protein n=1 Tax=Tanacetum coccineum TaxID=301880 RepID=A0ABQ5FK31_9ASTR